MSIQLKPGRTASDQLRYGIESALAEIRHLLGAEATEPSLRIHQARTAIKRVRALLLLLADDIGRPCFRFEKGALQSAGRALGPLRDPTSLLEAWDGLLTRSALSAPPELRQALLEECERALQSERVSLTTRYVEGLLAAAQSRLELWPNRQRDAESVIRGLARNYARARRAYRRAEKDPSSASLHTLRRFNKRYQYQLQFLEPVRSSAMQARRRRVQALSELLGEHHDLQLLSAAFERDRHGVGDLAFLGLRTLMASRERQLRVEALALAARVYRGRAKRIAHRLRRQLLQFRRASTTAEALRLQA